jgi:hypothetical protein
MNEKNQFFSEYWLLMKPNAINIFMTVFMDTLSTAINKLMEVFYCKKQQKFSNEEQTVLKKRFCLGKTTF